MNPLINFDPHRIPKRWDRHQHVARTTDLQQTEVITSPGGITPEESARRSAERLREALTHSEAHFPPALKSEIEVVLTQHHYPASYAGTTFCNLVYCLCREHIQYALNLERQERLESIVVKLARQRRLGFLPSLQSQC